MFFLLSKEQNTKHNFECRKIQIIRPGLKFVPKAFMLGIFSEGLIIGGNFAFQNGLALTIKTAMGLNSGGLIIGRIFASEI